MRYHIDKDMLGHPRVNYLCPSCSVKLHNPLKDAGTNETCPECKVVFVVPGEQELKTHNERLAQEQLKKNQEKEQRMRTRAEQKASRMLAKQQDHLKRSKNTKSETGEGKLVDNFLRLVFKIARALSVIIISLTAIAAGLAFVAFLYNWSMPLPEERVPVDTSEIPVLADASHLKRQAYRSSGSSRSNTQTNNSNDPIEKRLVKLVDGDERLGSALYLDFLRAIDYRDQEVALAGLEDLMREREKLQNADPEVSWDAIATMTWYLDEFSSRRELENARRLINIESRKAARQASLFALLFTVGAFLAFVYLPLLIQIERNTRELIASNKSTDM